LGNRLFFERDWRKTKNWGIKTAFPVMICIVCCSLTINYFLLTGLILGMSQLTVPLDFDDVQKMGMFFSFFNTQIYGSSWQLPTRDFSGDRFFFNPEFPVFRIFVNDSTFDLSFSRFRKNCGL
jgi:hypothetical protein